MAAAIRALNPRRVILSRDAVPITLTADINLTSPAAYILFGRQGQMLRVQVTNTVYVQVLDAQGLSLTFPSQSAELAITQTGDYVVVVRGNGRATVNIALSPP